MDGGDDKPVDGDPGCCSAPFRSSCCSVLVNRNDGSSCLEAAASSLPAATRGGMVAGWDIKPGWDVASEGVVVIRAVASRAVLALCAARD